MNTLRLATLIATLLLALNQVAFANDAVIQPTRFIVIRAWHGETLVTMTQVPLVPGHPTTVMNGAGGPAVPEGMAAPPLKVSMLMSVRIVGSADKVRYANLDQTDAALATANHYVVDDVEIRILERDADRFAAVVFDQLANAEQAVTLPADLAFDADDKEFLPEGVITAWVSGSLVPMKEPVLIDRAPARPSITLPENGPQ